MKLFYSDYFQKKLAKRLSKNPQLKSKVSKQLHFLEHDVRHPSLRLHKLKGDRADQYAIWIEADMRITFLMVEDGVLLTDVISHDEY